MDEKPIVPTNCFFQGCYNPACEAEIRKCKALCHAYNQICPNEGEALRNILEKLLGGMGRDTIVTPPFWCDYGYHITVGDFFYSNHNLVIQDGANVRFGDHVFVGPNFCFTTAEHAIDPDMRRAGVVAVGGVPCRGPLPGTAADHGGGQAHLSDLSRGVMRAGRAVTKRCSTTKPSSARRCDGRRRATDRYRKSAGAAL